MRKVNLIGQRFGRLIVLSEGDPIGKFKTTSYRCLCDCGTKKDIRTGDLKSGRTKSCGCLNKNNATKKAKSMGLGNKILPPGMASAKLTYKRRYNVGSISFEEFLLLSQNNCFYCEKPPSNITNRYLGRTSYSTIEDFIYNGLDRIDSNKTYSLDNIVVSCKYCNWAKRALTIEEFLEHIASISYYRKNKWEENFSNLTLPILVIISESIVTSLKFSKKDLKPGATIGKWTLLSKTKAHYGRADRDLEPVWICRCLCGVEKQVLEATLLRGRSKSCGATLCKRKVTPKTSALKVAYGHYHKNGDTISFNEFYQLSQMNCYYCGKSPSNWITGRMSNKKFSYNGLDRINSSKPHIINNVVPCCANCNWMKHERSLEEFNNWVTIVYNRIDLIRSKINDITGQQSLSIKSAAST